MADQKHVDLKRAMGILVFCNIIQCTLQLAPIGAKLDSDYSLAVLT
jgi:hypothetical protein